MRIGTSAQSLLQSKVAKAGPRAPTGPPEPPGRRHLLLRQAPKLVVAAFLPRCEPES